MSGNVTCGLSGNVTEAASALGAVAVLGAAAVAENLTSAGAGGGVMRMVGSVAGPIVGAAAHLLGRRAPAEEKVEDADAEWHMEPDDGTEPEPPKLEPAVYADDRQAPAPVEAVHVPVPVVGVAAPDASMAVPIAGELDGKHVDGDDDDEVILPVFLTGERRTRGLADIIRMHAPATAPNLSPEVEAGPAEVEEAVRAMERHYGRPLSVQAILNGRRRAAMARAEIGRLRFRITQIETEEADEHEMLGVYDCVERMRQEVGTRRRRSVGQLQLARNVRARRG